MSTDGVSPARWQSQVRRVGARRRARRRTWRAARGAGLLEPRLARLWLVLLVVGLAVAGSLLGEDWFPATTFVVPLLGSGLLVSRRSVLALIILVVIAIGCELGVQGWHAARPGGLLVVAITAVVAYQLAATRERLGVQGLRGEAMLVDLRDRLRRLGELPALPGEWHAEAVVRSAGHATFGGDFLVAATTNEGQRLEIVLVDVSGKGVDAATRALSLAGAFGGLLGAVPPEGFLTAANAYLLRQRWPEGFASAIHLALDLTTGDFLLQSAGHPPAVHFRSGSGTWRVVEAEGTLLGALDSPHFTAAFGTLAHGDALLLYTDGLVETPEREISVGIDKLIGEAERLVTRGFRGGARWLLDTVAPSGNDDQALIVIWRD